VAGLGDVAECAQQRELVGCRLLIPADDGLDLVDGADGALFLQLKDQGVPEHAALESIGGLVARRQAESQPLEQELQLLRGPLPEESSAQSTVLCIDAGPAGGHGKENHSSRPEHFL
jgi:hypothetical protein